MANIHDPSSWGNLPKDAITKLIKLRQIMTKEDEIRCSVCEAINCTCGEDF